MKLWEKGYQLNPLVEAFMTGNDPSLDLALIHYDCMGSIAHARMLHKIEILNVEECGQIIKGLKHIIDLSKEGQFLIRPDDEDVHTAVENMLTEWIGDAGKKLHTGRSRNDQVLLDIRLYSRDRLLQLVEEALNLSTALCTFAEKHKDVPFPGRTHFQRAMPSSLGLWAGAFAESFCDDASLLKSAYELNNQSPLGSAAGYGVSLPINRQYCADLLGFQKVQNNVLYAANSRGKFEGVILHAMVQTMNDLAKAATDIILFSAPEFGYIKLPEKFCTGSSLMPQKRNPDPLELIRAKSTILQGCLFQTLEIIRGLPSGYHRDFQETKRPLMQGFDETLSSVKVFSFIVKELEVDKEACLNAFSPELFATDQALSLAFEGIPFREAYKQVSRQINQLPAADPVENILSKTHMGATGNLGLDLCMEQIQKIRSWMDSEKCRLERCLEQL